MSDINILRFFMNRKQFQSTYNALPVEVFDVDTIQILGWFQYYFKTYKEDANVNISKLETLMKLDKGTDKTTYDLMKFILTKLREPIDPVVHDTILEQLEERLLSAQIGLLLKQYNDGAEVDFSTEVLTKAQASYDRRKVKHSGAWEDGDVWQMVQEDADNSGYLLSFLPRTFYMKIKGINKGDNICVAAPTNKGKTSFLARMAVEFAKQHRELYLADEALRADPEWEQPEGYTPMVWQPVLYLVNESTSRKITPRIYQTALEVDRQGLYDIGTQGQLNDRYIDVMGRRDAIRLVDIHGYTLNEVIRVIEQHNPFMVVTDMTGRIRVHSNNGANDVAQLEEAWESMRTQAAIHKFIHVGTAQISKEGFDTFFPPLSAIQNSKTGVQTTWDLGLFIGALELPSEGQEGVRGISTPKSKMARSGAKAELQELTHFDPEMNTWKLPEPLGE